MKPNTEMKVVLKASDIPNNATVTKPTGTAIHTLTRQIRFFPLKGQERQTIRPENGCVFLVNGNGDVNVYPPHKEFVWLVDAEDFQQFLDKQLDSRSYK